MRGLSGAGIAVVAWAGGSVLAKGIDMPAMAIGVYRFALFTMIMVVWLRTRGTPLTLRALKYSLPGGIALGLDIAFFFSAVKLTNVVNATLIGALQPILVGVIAARFFGESIKRRDALWSLAALAGVVGVVIASNGTPEWSLKGDLLAFAAMLCWGAYFIASKESKKNLTPVEFTTGTAFWTAIINLPLGLAFGQDLSWPNTRSWMGLLLMTVAAGFIGHTLMNWSLVRIPLWVGSTFTLLIPVASAILAWVFLDESLSLSQAAAMAVVLFALAVIVRGQADDAKTTRASAPSPKSPSPQVPAPQAPAPESPAPAAG